MIMVPSYSWRNWGPKSSSGLQKITMPGKAAPKNESPIRTGRWWDALELESDLTTDEPCHGVCESMGSALAWVQI